VATKYCRADGSAVWADATGPESSAGDCCTLATAGTNADAGDIVYISGLGGVFRETLTPSNSGSNGSPITFSGISSAKICGADILTGWSDQTGNIWRATWAGDAASGNGIWMDGTVGVSKGSSGACTQEFDFYYNAGSNYIDIYAASDPDTRYTDPGVEVSARWQTCNVDSKDYVTVENIEFCQSIGDCVRFRNGGTDIIFSGCTVWGAGESVATASYQDGMLIEDYSNVLVSECEFYRNAWNGCAYHNNGAGALSNYIVEKCHLHDNGHNGIDSKCLGSGNNSGVIYRYNRVNGSYQNGLMMLTNDTETGIFVSAKVHNNVVFENGYCGMYLASETGTVYFTGFEIVNNTVADNGKSGTYGPGIWYGGSGATIQNNIVCRSYNEEITVTDGGGTQNDVDYNLVWKTGADSGTDLYAEDGTDYNHTEYKSFGQQTNAPDIADPGFTDEDNDDYTLASDSPCIGAGANLGSPYNTALMPSSTWPDGVVTGNQDDY